MKSPISKPCSVQSSRAWYALRRPLPPWRFEELLAEMLKHLPSYRVDEVIVMLDVEDFFHNHPTPEIAREWTKNLVRARELLASAGIAYSLNPWITRGHEDRGRRAADALPGIQTVVHADGTQATCVACNLSPVWRDNLRRVWSLYAGTKPHVLWLDDDIRDFGAHECFCPLHLEKISRRVGKEVTRAELTAAILKPGEPHPWRAEWLALRAEASLEVLRLVANAAHAASPQTVMGLMSSGPRNHCREGRDWQRVAEVLGATKERPIFSRPTMGNYWEWGPPRGLYFSQDSIKLTRHSLPPGTVDCTELENVPFSRYSKSVAFTFAQLAVSFAFGARAATLDIFDFIGTPMQAEPHYGKMLGDRKNFLNALAETARRPGVLRGVRLLFKENSALSRRLTLGEKNDAALAGEGYPALEAFEAAGIPTTYDESEVTFLCGQQPHLLDDDEIRRLLKHGLFLDATAAEVLCQRGFAAEIGLEKIKPPEMLEQLGAYSVEDFSHPDFGGTPRSFMSAQMPRANYSAKFSVLQPATRAVVLGHLHDADAIPVYPAMIAFENPLGGRVIIHAWDYASAIDGFGVSFHNPVRCRQIQATVRWLFRSRVPLAARGDGVWPLALRKDCGNETLVGLMNLSLDAWPCAEIEMSAPAAPAAIRLLDADGKWIPVDSRAWETRDSVILLTLVRPVALESPLFLNVVWK
jgi:hypothetical protein